MTQDEIKPQDHPDSLGGWMWTPLGARWIEERITQAILAEREACAKVCDEYDNGRHANAADLCATAIRARGQA
jgi:hypothetical protein